MGEKLLSVIVASYNMEQYLPKCLGSMVVPQAQLDRLEVIVVNDGSKDRTSEIAHGFETRYPDSFRVIDKPNGHYGSCINVGLASAKGIYIKVLDADDWVDTKGFANFIAYLETLDTDEVDVVFSDVGGGDVKGNVTAGKRLDLPTDRTFDFSILPSPRDVFWGQNRYVYKTALVRKIGYRQTEGVPYTDSEWMTFPWSAMRRMRYCPGLVSVVLVGRDGQTMNPKTYMRDFGIVVDLTRGMLRNLPVYTKDANKEQSSYVREKVLHMVDHVYETCLLCKPKADLRAFDEELRVYFPDFYGEGRCRIKLLFWRVDIVPFWRRHPRCCGGLVAMYRFQQFFRRPLGRIKRALIRTR